MTTVSQAVLARNHPPRKPARGRAKADARVTADSVSHGVRADTASGRGPSHSSPRLPQSGPRTESGDRWPQCRPEGPAPRPGLTPTPAPGLGSPTAAAALSPRGLGWRRGVWTPQILAGEQTGAVRTQRGADSGCPENVLHGQTQPRAASGRGAGYFYFLARNLHSCPSRFWSLSPVLAAAAPLSTRLGVPCRRLKIHPAPTSSVPGRWRNQKLTPKGPPASR